MANVFTDFGSGMTAWSAPLDARLAFVRRTYAHLAAAVALFVAASWACYTANVGVHLVEWMQGMGLVGLLLVLGGFMVTSMVATSLASSARSPALQYVGLISYALLLSLFVSPLISYAAHAFPGTHILETATALTLVTFAALTGFVLTTKKDLSFLRTILGVALLVVMGVVVASLIFGFSLGLWYTGAMILFAAGAILYATSNVLHHYRTDQHVGAALALFAGVIMLFVQILQLLMELQGGDRRRG